ncbi:MAG: hypothetical protein E7Z90_07110 [Cyanobacteria bacterium SIG29]|nr:hypothetical protein [Cyanobacteria bacterium SIG29]
MKISAVNQNYASFKAAQLNILATSDNHGNVHSLPRLVSTIETHKPEIFEKANEPSTLNVFAIAGDWFINPSKKGFITHPKKTNGDIQLNFLQKTIERVRLAAGNSSNFETIFTMGNHDLDGGDSFMYKVMSKAPMKTLVTNVNMLKSPRVKQATEKTPEKLAKSFEFEIPDDKNPKLKHKVLFVGATIPTMGFYNPGLLKNMEFLDNGNQKDANLTEQDIQGTVLAIKKEVDDFKQKNPKGAVILLSHMGNRLSKIVRASVPQINVILNGHDHKALTSLVGKTHIDSLGKDNELVRSFNLRFDDNGDLEQTDLHMFDTDLTLTDTLSNHPINLELQKSFKEDMTPLVSVTSELDGNHELDYADEIRYSNSYLANYLTSAVKRSVRKMVPDVYSVAIQSSIIRGGIKDGANNLDLMKVFDGVSEDLSDLQIGEVAGYELSGLITENILANLKAPTRNTIIHWSDIQVDRSLIEDIKAGRSDKKYEDAIKVKNEKTRMFEPINLQKQYKIVLPEKFLVKDDITWPKKIRGNFTSLGKTYDNLFREYLETIKDEDGKFDIRITAKTAEKRIINKEQ